MKARFEGTDGKRLLQQALQSQIVAGHNDAIAGELASAGKLEEFSTGQRLIVEGDSDSDVFLIVSGRVQIEKGGTPIAIRRSGEHVGELALIDPKARRAASVTAIEPTLITRIAEPEFSQIAVRHPEIWRRLALELGDRLRERLSDIRQRNERPIVFIGSTVERLDIARALQTAFQHDPWVSRVWTDGVFQASQTPIESLVAQLDRLDLGILVVTADDLTESRGSEHPSPRDNVIFELGLLVGALGRERTFMVRLRDERNLKLPSDLMGIKALEVVPGDRSNLASRVGPAADEFRTIINRIGPR